ncbi:flagellar hook assembly protein FlgD [Xenophilus arseniciresistens]|uniref:Basal-body rod modification protein FlgD n=1 Tax=Xenophilus arseniciresistens TaxID=1283306 RepID=A0AAE3SZI2_9BURK|nr:flagellar hook capping FlgD N-terminal domain-containing protein [Xenophilus arseniciresistens]MDA7415252.1 flagellar hook assembly protein FlgD [Xenophilus arseniciresistens]
MSTALSNLTGVTQSYNITSSADAGTAPAKTGSEEAQDRFLKLLVAQMSNQDPMNPMDNAQMTSQIAQINTVTGIQQLNDSIKAMASQASAMQMMQASAMIGRGVITPGNQLAFSDADTAVAAFDLPTGATSVKIQVTTASGTLIDTVSLGAMEAGQHGFSLDASSYPDDQALKFNVVAVNGSGTVDATALMHDRVTSVGSAGDGSLTLTLQHNGSTPYASVRSVL